MTPAMDGIRETTASLGKRTVCVAETGTVVIDVLGNDMVQVVCLGALEHYAADGCCEHTDRFCELNPELVIKILPRGGPDLEQLLAVDLEWRRKEAAADGGS